MKKTLNIIVVICLCILIFTVIVANKRIHSLQIDLNNLKEDVGVLSSKMKNHISAVAPLTVSEVETFQHNLDVLNESLGAIGNRPIVMANWCFDLKRTGKMESAWLVSANKRVISEKDYYIEIMTEDQEYYWFLFYEESSDIVAIFKGLNKETLLYAEVC